mmetsp:Transcript_1187/g.7761  ORF Transcript_1187/g.7761 Transcript_1187/m.7761 type:complete len:206 (+) Transcript_1187:1576-2193(+)
MANWQPKGWSWRTQALADGRNEAWKARRRLDHSQDVKQTPWRGGTAAWKDSSSCRGCRHYACRRPTTRKKDKWKKGRRRRTRCPPLDGACDTCADPWCPMVRRKCAHVCWKAAKGTRQLPASPPPQRLHHGPSTAAYAALKWEPGGSPIQDKEMKEKRRLPHPLGREGVRTSSPLRVDNWVQVWAMQHPKKPWTMQTLHLSVQRS